MSLANFWIVLLGCLAISHAAPTVAPTTSAEDKSMAEGYLSRFYNDVEVTNSTVRRIVTSSFSQDLQTMQAFSGLEVTGMLDNETVEEMRAPRCGVSDISRYGLHKEGIHKWEKSSLKYRITKYTTDLTKDQVDATIAQAFKLYSDVIPLDFKQVNSGDADIVISFDTKEFVDSKYFDGNGGYLAHAFYPGHSKQGQLNFDDDERWSLTKGRNLLLVAAHELGHTLGLEHVSDKTSLMYHKYRYVDTNGYSLPEDDKLGVQALYGSRRPLSMSEETPTPPPGPDPEPEPEEPTEDPNPDPLPNPRGEQCSRDLVFDAATSIRGDLFFFKNGYYWRKSSTTKGIRFTKVNTKWSQINYVDAAFEVPSKDVVYLFEGSQYWGIRAHAKTVISGFPKSLTNLGLPSSVSKVDAAVFVPTTNKTLIFVNNQYWSYDEGINQMDIGYPRNITQDFRGIGSKVDAVFESHGYLYFSDGPRQLEYSLPSRSVKRLLLNYGWLNCY